MVDQSSACPIQIELMKENCILVNENDEILGPSSKENCHSIANGHSLLHRAFSVFLFDKGRLLLQKRSKSKITFPSMWTNTCCSHPLFSIEREKDQDENRGVRYAAIRKLNHELGIRNEDLEIDEFLVMARMHYQAKSCDQWGEHEIDYLLFIQKDNLALNLNDNEVEEVLYVSKSELISKLATMNEMFTPWFKMVANEKYLYKWWDELTQKGSFQESKEINIIRL